MNYWVEQEQKAIDYLHDIKPKRTPKGFGYTNVEEIADDWKHRLKIERLKRHVVGCYAEAERALDAEASESRGKDTDK
jgi:hypothetical protein